jgi:hypothetical protein
MGRRASLKALKERKKTCEALGRSKDRQWLERTRASLCYCALAWLNGRIPAGDHITRGVSPLSGSMMQRLSKLGRVDSAGLGISAVSAEHIPADRCTLTVILAIRSTHLQSNPR